MALIKCAECGTEISDKAAACVKCGAPVSAVSTVPPTTKDDRGLPWYVWGLGGIVGLFVLMLIIGSNADPAKQIEREAISLCWDSQKRKDIDPGTARFAASACYKMEDDFKLKWHVNP